MGEARWERIVRGGNVTAVIFVHGLTGNFRATWGDFPDLVAKAPEFEHCDLGLWGYPTDLVPFWARLPWVGKRTPEVAQVAKALRTDLVLPDKAGAYVDLVLVGHSLGGLVILQMLADCLDHQDGRRLLRRVRQVVLYASPTQGVQIPNLLKLNRQIRDLDRHSLAVEQIRRTWAPPDARSPLLPPVKAIFGTQDATVPEASATGLWYDREAINADHTSIVKPSKNDDSAFGILKQVVQRVTVPWWVHGDAERRRVIAHLVTEAQVEIFTIGSRSRDTTYLALLESRMEADPDLKYTRVLMGPPRNQALKDHVGRIVELATTGAPVAHGDQRIAVGLFEDLAKQFEFNLMGNERRCLLVLPSAQGHVGDYDTAIVLGEPSMVQGYRALAHALLAAGTALETPSQVAQLPVLG